MLLREEGRNFFCRAIMQLKYGKLQVLLIFIFFNNSLYLNLYFY